MARGVVIGTLFRVPHTRRLLAGRLSGIGIAYPRARDDHPMTGRRMPDVHCDGTRVYELLREGRFVLLTAADVDIDRPAVVQAVDAAPALPDAVLVRPDGYVAWASERLPHADEVTAAIDHWCPTSA